MTNHLHKALLAFVCSSAVALPSTLTAFQCAQPLVEGVSQDEIAQFFKSYLRSSEVVFVGTLKSSGPPLRTRPEYQLYLDTIVKMRAVPYQGSLSILLDNAYTFHGSIIEAGTVSAAQSVTLHVRLSCHFEAYGDCAKPLPTNVEIAFPALMHSPDQASATPDICFSYFVRDQVETHVSLADLAKILAD